MSTFIDYGNLARIAHDMAADKQLPIVESIEKAVQHLDIDGKRYYFYLTISTESPEEETAKMTPYEGTD